MLEDGSLVPLHDLDQLVKIEWPFWEFIEQNGLMNERTYSQEDFNESFRVERGDLSELGREFFRIGHMRWSNALDRYSDAEVGEFISSRGLSVLKRALADAKKNLKP